MQKLINALAISSFVVSAAVVAGGTYVYLNKDALIDQVKQAAMEQVASSLPSILPAAELPSVSSPSALPITLPF